MVGVLHGTIGGKLGVQRRGAHDVAGESKAIVVVKVAVRGWKLVGHRPGAAPPLIGARGITQAGEIGQRQVGIATDAEGLQVEKVNLVAVEIGYIASP